MRATASMIGDELVAVHGRLAAERAEQRLAADQVGELRDIALGAGGDGEGDVAEHLGHGAAEAEGHDGAEGGVALHADHELAAAGDHLLDEHRLERVAGALRERGVRLGDLVRGAQVEDHQLRLGLVLDERADGLHGDGRAERGGEVGGLGGGVDEAAGGARARRRRRGPAWRRPRRARDARPRAPSRRSRALARARRGPRLASRLLFGSGVGTTAHVNCIDGSHLAILGQDCYSLRQHPTEEAAWCTSRVRRHVSHARDGERERRAVRARAHLLGRAGAGRPAAAGHGARRAARHLPRHAAHRAPLARERRLPGHHARRPRGLARERPARPCRSAGTSG